MNPQRRTTANSWRKRRVLLLWAAAAGWMLGAARGATPELELGARLMNNDSLLTVATMSAPSVIDWNNDGRRDLLVGQFDNGNVWLFLNRGTDEAPIFKGGTRVNASGVPIAVSYG